MHRRSFVRTATALAIGGAVGGTAAACGGSGSGAGGAGSTASGAASVDASAVAGSPSASPVASTPATASAADWTALGRGLAGRLVRPGDADYDTARLLFNPRFDGERPAGVAFCENPSDVAECLAFVRKFGVAVTPRSGGHSYAGLSSGPGLVVDVTRMNAVTDVGSGTARVGAGTRLVDLYAGLDAYGVTVPGGSCPTVGVAGLVLGGGIGVVSRAYGTLSDNLRSVQMVMPDGTVRECDAAQHSDLFWACRGGGGGNFGIATAFTFNTHPAEQLVLFFLNWPWSSAARVITAWQSWAPTAPDELWSDLHALSNETGDTPTIQVGGTYLGSLSGAQQLISQLVGAASRSTRSAARSTGSRRTPRRSYTRRPLCSAVHDHLERRRDGRADRCAAGLAACVPPDDDAIREWPGVSELFRSGADRLAAGLLRRELPETASGARDLWPRPRAETHAGHRNVIRCLRLCPSTCRRCRDSGGAPSRRSSRRTAS